MGGEKNNYNSVHCRATFSNGNLQKTFSVRVYQSHIVLEKFWPTLYNIALFVYAKHS